MRRNNALPNSDYDNLSQSDMKEVVCICAKLLRPGGHVIMFCTVQQFVMWENLFRDYQESPNEPPLFQVSSAPCLNIPQAGAASGMPYQVRMTLKNIVEYVFQATRVYNGPREDAMEMVDWQHHGYVHSTHPAHYNVIDGVPRFAPGERVVEGSPAAAAAAARATGYAHATVTGTGADAGATLDTAAASTKTRTRMLRAEQKSIALIMEYLSRYSKPGDLVVDLFAGTCTTAVACLSLQHHRKFVGCDIDRKIVSVGRARVLNTFIINAVNGHMPSGVYISNEVRAKWIPSTSATSMESRMRSTLRE